MIIQGKWHPAGSAAQSVASLEVYDGVFKMTITDNAGYNGLQSSLVVSDRIGNVERKITLEDGSLFVTRDNDGIDALFKTEKTASGFVHAIESNMKWVAVALVVTVISAFSFFKWGVPWASDKIAHALPEKTNALIADGSLKFLDKYIFKKTKFDTAKQDKIRSHFMTKLVPLGSKEKSYKLHFRSWKMGDLDIPNAMALPSGDIIVTDKFIELAKSQEEIDSVLLHEMGHVEHRHSLEMLIESTFITAAVMLVMGDLNMVGDMGVGLGSALVSSSYSRGHESEADSFAFKKMLLIKMDPAAFSAIMNRMTVYMEEERERKAVKDQGKQTKDAKSKTEKTAKEKESIWGYLSSHPSTKERVKNAQHYSECFKKGLTSCEIVGDK